ncbi:MAG: alpha/beta hydrolase [Chloroflexaceae bacterium]|jgi:pimeloyl-ACP methyl ester carboxylesterase|nr:alpha/beta hydrolase [Chloroflexaceae bacterium]
MPSFTHAGHTLTWETHNSDDHPIIFIHGYSGNRAIWRRELERFAPLGRCITLDLPGHYPATVPAGYRTLHQDDLIELETRAVQAIVGNSPVTLVGHSTGGLVALAVAARLPQQVQRVVSLNSVVWGPLSGVLRQFQRWLRTGGYARYWLLYRMTQLSFRLMMQGIADSYVADAKALRHNRMVWEACRLWHPSYRHSRIHNFAVLLRMLESCDIRPLIAGMAVPVLAITGAADPVVPAEQTRWLARHLPHVQLHVLENVGHMTQWEAAPQFEQLVSNWLAEPVLG